MPAELPWPTSVEDRAAIRYDDSLP